MVSDVVCSVLWSGCKHLPRRLVFHVGPLNPQEFVAVFVHCNIFVRFKLVYIDYVSSYSLLTICFVYATCTFGLTTNFFEKHEMTKVSKPGFFYYKSSIYIF